MPGRSADEAGLSTDSNPRQRRRLTSPDSDGDSFGGDHFQAAPQGRVARPFERAAVQEPDVFSQITAASGSAGSAAECAELRSAEAVVSVAAALKVQMDPAHYRGVGYTGQIAAMFGYELPQAEPTPADLAAFLLGAGQPLKQLKDDAGRVSARLQSLLSTLRDRLHSMGSAVQELRQELPLLLDRWNVSVTLLHVMVLATLSLHSGDCTLVSDSTIRAKPFEQECDDVKLQKVMLGRLQEQGRMVKETGGAYVLCHHLIVDLGNGRKMPTHVWPPLFRDKLKHTGTSVPESGTHLEVKMWLDCNQAVGDPIEHQLFSSRTRVANCADYIGTYPPLQLSEPNISMFSFAGAGTGAILNVLTEEVHPMGEGVPRQQIVGGHHDCTAQGGFQTYPDNMGDFETGTWFDIPTALDQVFDDRGQGFDPFVQRVAWAMGVGRMATRKNSCVEWGGVVYPTRDVVDCMTFFHGKGGSGKSLSVLTAEFMYNSDRTIVGSLPDNPEEGFPLSNVWDKKIVVATELSEKFRLPSTTFNAMMSGENVTITVKHKHSFDVPWLSHVSCAGNSFWGTESNNGQGQLDRRVLLFQFRQLEETRKDPTIKARIEADMLPIIIKGIRAYKSLIAAAKAHTATGVDVKTYIDSKTPYFLDSIAQVQSHKALDTFLISNVVTPHPDARMTTQEFMDLYQTWCRKASRKQPLLPDTVAGAFSRLEARYSITKLPNPWNHAFSIGPKDTKGFVRDGVGHYLGIAEAGWVARKWPQAPVLGDVNATAAAAAADRDFTRRFDRLQSREAAYDAANFLD